MTAEPTERAALDEVVVTASPKPPTAEDLMLKVAARIMVEAAYAPPRPGETTH